MFKRDDIYGCVNENIVTVIPLDAERRKEIDKLSYPNESNQEDQWLYGLSEDNCCVASILFNNQSDYTREFDVEVNGEEFKISYSVSTADLWMETEKVPDLRNSIHSILRFDFKTEHELCDIEKYYSYAMHLFQFCTGRLNVRSEIRLYKKEQNQPILLRFIDGFNNYADDVLDFTQVIRFQFLNDLFPSLFEILNEENA